MTAGPKQQEAWIQILINKRVAYSLPIKNILVFPSTTIKIDYNMKVWLLFFGEEEGGVIYSGVLLNDQRQRRQHFLKIKRSGLKKQLGEYDTCSSIGRCISFENRLLMPKYKQEVS